MKLPRVVIADPMSIFRSGVCTLLTKEGGFDVVAAADLDQLVAVVEDECPDLALIDADLPPAGGLLAVEKLFTRFSTCCIVWSFAPTPDMVLAAIRAGLPFHSLSFMSASTVHHCGRRPLPVSRDAATRVSSTPPLRLTRVQRGLSR